MRQAVTDADTSIKQYEASLEAELDSRHAPVRAEASPWTFAVRTCLIVQGSLDQATIDANKKQTDAEIQQLK